MLGSQVWLPGVRGNRVLISCDVILTERMQNPKSIGLDLCSYRGTLAPGGNRVLVKDSDCLVVVRVPSVFAVSWLEQRMYQTILRALRGCSGNQWNVWFEASEAVVCLVHGG